MELYLLRHGIAYDSEAWAGKSDESRPLTNTGTAAMEREANYLKSARIKIDGVLSSPLARARQTAQIVATAFGIELRESALLKPGFNVKALEVLLEETAQFEHLMLVGHAPDFSEVIAHVIGGGQVEMPKGGFARIHMLHRSPPRGTLYSLLPPEALGA